MFLDSGVRGQVEFPFPTDKEDFTSSGELMKGRLHLREEGAEATKRMSGVFRGTQTDNVEQHLLVGATDNLVAESEKPEPTPSPPKNDTAAIWITRPLNDTLLPLGDIFLAFETQGFTPAVETPIEASMSRGTEFRFSSVPIEPKPGTESCLCCCHLHTRSLTT